MKPFLATAIAVFTNQRHIMSALSDLQAKVDSNTQITAAAVNTINGLRQQVADLTAQLNDGTALDTLSTQIAADDAALQAAIDGPAPTVEAAT